MFVEYLQLYFQLILKKKKKVPERILFM